MSLLELSEEAPYIGAKPETHIDPLVAEEASLDFNEEQFRGNLEDSGIRGDTELFMLGSSSNECSNWVFLGDCSPAGVMRLFVLNHLVKYEDDEEASAALNSTLKHEFTHRRDFDRRVVFEDTLNERDLYLNLIGAGIGVGAVASTLVTGNPALSIGLSAAAAGTAMETTFHVNNIARHILNRDMLLMIRKYVHSRFACEIRADRFADTPNPDWDNLIQVTRTDEQRERHMEIADFVNSSPKSFVQRFLGLVARSS